MHPIAFTRCVAFVPEAYVQRLRLPADDARLLWWGTLSSLSMGILGLLPIAPLSVLYHASIHKQIRPCFDADV